MYVLYSHKTLNLMEKVGKQKKKKVCELVANK